MTDSFTIEINALRIAINGILDFIEQDLGQKTVELKQNYYWVISDEDLYAMGNEPQEIKECGSLKDDWDFVLPLVQDINRQLPIMFIHIAPLLQAMAHSVPNFTKDNDSPN